MRVLEFDRVVERVTQHCETSIGASQATALRPSTDESAVWDALTVTDEASQLLSTDPPPSLGAVTDRRDALRYAQKGGSLSGDVLVAVGDALRAQRQFRRHLAPKSERMPRLSAAAAQLIDAPQVESRILDSLDGSGEVRDTASAVLAELRRKVRATGVRILERIQSYTTGKSRDLLSDPIYTQRDGRYVIPLKAENRGKIRGIVHDTSGSGQTIYVEPDDVVQLGNALREAEAAEREEVARILRDLSRRVGEIADVALPSWEWAGWLDFALAKARYAHALRAGMPERAAAPGLELVEMRHPLLDPAKVVPISLDVGFAHRGVLITGPNTGGKTVALKCVGLAMAMAQSGLFIPAVRARIGVASGLFADIGDEQSIEQSLSTFSAHVKNMGDALRHLTPGALVILDELGAGTDPAEGAALAQAVVAAILDAGALLVASTHFGELKAYAYERPDLINASMEFDAKTLRPTYRVRIGTPGASHALKIAERYGMPKSVLESARHHLDRGAVQVAQMLEELEASTKRARAAQSEADRLAAKLRHEEEVAARKLAEADEVRRNAFRRAQDTVDEAVRRLRQEAEAIFESLKANPGDTHAKEEGRRRLRALLDEGSSIARRLDTAPRAVPTHAFQKGDAVRVNGRDAVVLDASDAERVVVQVGPMKLTVPKASVTPAPKPATARSNSAKQSLAGKSTVGTELHLRAMRAEDAAELLERFLDEALLGGAPYVRIVHGKGEGILRKVTHEVLRRHPEVAQFRDGEPSEGGHGVTIAKFK